MNKITVWPSCKLRLIPVELNHLMKGPSIFVIIIARVHTVFGVGVDTVYQALPGFIAQAAFHCCQRLRNFSLFLFIGLLAYIVHNEAFL